MKQCELCKLPARTFCESDEASLCWDCDAKVHAANFLVARHCRRLLCGACQSPTPWTSSGAKLCNSVSVCEDCAAGGERTEGVASDVGGGDDTDGDDAEEDEEEAGEGDNQVVPLSTSTPPPPASSSSSASSEGSGYKTTRSESLNVLSMKRSRSFFLHDDDHDVDVISRTCSQRKYGRSAFTRDCGDGEGEGEATRGGR